MWSSGLENMTNLQSYCNTQKSEGLGLKFDLRDEDEDEDAPHE